MTITVLLGDSVRTAILNTQPRRVRECYCLVPVYMRYSLQSTVSQCGRGDKFNHLHCSFVVLFWDGAQWVVFAVRMIDVLLFSLLVFPVCLN